MNCSTDPARVSTSIPASGLAMGAGLHTSSELDPAALRAMLSEMSGTPLPIKETWDAEAGARLADFQRSEGLTPTGEPDDVTVQRLTVRHESVVGGHAAERVGPPASAEAHARIEHVLEEALHGAHYVAEQLAGDAGLREAYTKEAQAYAKDILTRLEHGTISEGEAALRASHFRNNVMMQTRTGLSPAGQLLSKFLKKEGATLEELAGKYAQRNYGKPFLELTEAERNSVFATIAKKAGQTNPKVNGWARFAPSTSTVLLAVTIAVAMVEVWQAQDKVKEGVKQTAKFAGFAMGAAVGTAVGTAACGPACGVILGMAVGYLQAEAMEKSAGYLYDQIKG